MATQNPTGATDRLAARIVMDGDLARRFRREMLFEYRDCAESINHAGDDIAQLLAKRTQLAHIDDVLTDLGWDRDISDDDEVRLTGPAALLLTVVETHIVSSADTLKHAAENADWDAVDHALTDVRLWHGVLQQIRDTATGEDVS